MVALRSPLLAPLRRLCAIALACALGASTAQAAGDLVEGNGFLAQLPAGFRLASKDDTSSGCERLFRRRIDDGELRLKITSSQQADGVRATLELRLDEALDRALADASPPGTEASASTVQIEGASEAREAVLTAAEGSEYRLAARRGGLLVRVELLAAPGTEAAAAEAWRQVVGSLRLEDPSAGMPQVLLTILAALAAFALGLRLLRAVGLRGSAPPTATLTPDQLFAATRAAPIEERPVLPYEPATLPPSAPTLKRERAGALSRPADGLPEFDPEAKSHGVPEDLLKLPTVPRREPPRPARPASTTVPATVNLRPPPPSIRV